jgi:hypothetical protein
MPIALLALTAVVGDWLNGVKMRFHVLDNYMLHDPGERSEPSPAGLTSKSPAKADIRCGDQFSRHSSDGGAHRTVVGQGQFSPGSLSRTQISSWIRKPTISAMTPRGKPQRSAISRPEVRISG